MSSKNDDDNRKRSEITPTVYTGAKILCYGDSLTAGYCSPNFVPYGPSLQKSLGGEAVDYAGLCGYTARDMVRLADSESNEVFGLVYPGLRRLITNGDYNVVIIMAGTNDLGRSQASDIYQNLEQLHQMCHDAGIKTVAVTIPQSAFASDNTQKGKFNFRQKQQQVNSLLQEFASANPDQCFFVNMESMLPWSKGSQFWLSDGLHMSPKGYEMFGELLGPLISDFVSSSYRT